MKLTIKEALEQGYQHCGYAGHDYQIVMQIDDLIPDDFYSQQGKIMLFSKEFITPTCEENIKDFLADHVQEQWWDETSDDTNDVRDAIMAIDLSVISEKINDALKDKKYYTITDIELKP